MGTPTTVGINPRLSDLRGPRTSKLVWRYLEHNKIDRNELQIRTNSQKGTGTKIAEKLNNFEKFERKKSQISALFLTQRPPDCANSPKNERKQFDLRYHSGKVNFFFVFWEN